MNIKQLVFIGLMGLSSLVLADEFTDGIAIIEAAYGPIDELEVGSMLYEAEQLIVQALAEHQNNDVEAAITHINQAIELLELQSGGS